MSTHNEKEDYIELQVINDSHASELTEDIINIEDECHPNKIEENNHLPIVSCFIFISGISFNFMETKDDKYRYLIAICIILLCVISTVLSFFNNSNFISCLDPIFFEKAVETFNKLEYAFISAGLFITIISLMTTEFYTKNSLVCKNVIMVMFIIFLVLLFLFAIFKFLKIEETTKKTLKYNIKIFFILFSVLILTVFISDDIYEIFDFGNAVKKWIKIGSLFFIAIIMDMFYRISLKTQSFIAQSGYINIGILQLLLVTSGFMPKINEKIRNSVHSL